MRILLVTRGLPASGKSTWIRENQLDSFALSPDTLRVLAQSPQRNLDHSLSISQKNDPVIWEFFYKILETRMINGDFTVIDATNTNLTNITFYQKLCESYGYEMFVVDFSHIDLEICKQYNELRRLNGGVFIPLEVLYKMQMQLESNPLPKNIKTLTPSEWRKCLVSPRDLSSYEKIYHIGDLQGCFSVLKPIAEIQSNYFYIFLGDYIDRGIENNLVLEYLLEICDLPNVCLLEGNHERHLKTFARGQESSSKEFRDFTLPQIEASGLTKQNIMRFCKKLQPYFLYSFGDKTILCTHAGLPYLPKDLREISFIPAYEAINGVGGYDDVSTVAEIFTQNTPKNLYQIFGHRNREELPIRVNERVFVCEGKVEFGGDLRVVALDKEGFTTLAFKNEVFKERTTKSLVGVELLVDNLRKSPYIKERKFGDISSFNFTKKAFSLKVWNELTCRARGLFIDTKDFKIVARSYEKFFNLDEMEFVTLQSLRNTLKFPLQVFVKENGFLGIVSYYKDRLLVTTKGNIESDHVRCFTLLIKELDLEDKLIAFFTRNPKYSLVFEVIDPIFDPHIIEYGKKQLILLEAIKNTETFSKMPYNALQKFAKDLSVRAKQHYATLHNAEDLEDFITEHHKLTAKQIEGFVLEDTMGFMFKFKMPFYSYWKTMRSIVMGYAGKVRALCIKEDFKTLHTVLEYIDTKEPFLQWWRDRVMSFLEKGDKEQLNAFLTLSLIALRNEFIQFEKRQWKH